ncbi:Uncharacterized protein dnm_099620 [Desulfonema magnum]|uniref:Uncharacterized protein n=1 Tax=Desulfonema magnum TaxID=45655 RepID=A0A975GU67_9BACT|nr:Uncharacterized protein dnm_099620 [Desulfonema magnum]
MERSGTHRNSLHRSKSFRAVRWTAEKPGFFSPDEVSPLSKKPGFIPCLSCEGLKIFSIC